MTDAAWDMRQVLEITGSERGAFLQGLVTNDVPGAEGALIYAALLSPQGKYLADFFLHEDGTRLLLDVAAPLAEGLIKRLSLYKLRADVEITVSACGVATGPGAPAAGAFADPRAPGMGWRAYDGRDSVAFDRDAARVAQGVPAAGRELQVNDSYILEMGFERLHGVDFRKGCYVGQEVTARMKHKTELRKGLARVRLDGPAVEGAEITAAGKPVGRLGTISGDSALAYLRLDRAKGEMVAHETRLHLDAALL